MNSDRVLTSDVGRAAVINLKDTCYATVIGRKEHYLLLNLAKAVATRTIASASTKY